MILKVFARPAARNVADLSLWLGDFPQAVSRPGAAPYAAPSAGRTTDCAGRAPTASTPNCFDAGRARHPSPRPIGASGPASWRPPCPTAPPPRSSATATGSSQVWWPASPAPTTSLGVRRLATVTAHASASTTAGRQCPVPPGVGGAALGKPSRVGGRGRRSFRWSFLHAIPGTTGRHQADDVPDLSSNNGTQPDGSDSR
jgi:hypothetical protein